MRHFYTLLTLFAVFVLLYDFGFDQTPDQQRLLLRGYFFITALFSGFEVYHLFASKERSNLLSLLRLSLPFATLVIICFDWIVWKEPFLTSIVRREGLFTANVALLAFFELAVFVRRLYVKSLSPAMVFAGSFFLLILVGAFLLKLPNATVSGISFTDAVFTATSAVCVTGLAVLDTGREFTRMGQVFILALIQLGGLGVLTLTTFFAYFFTGGVSFQEHLHVKDFLNSDRLGGLLELAMKIVSFTLGIELIGALLIFFSLPEDHGLPLESRAFFALFHAVSAFCNAGFSTLSNGLYEGSFRFAYNLHWVIAWLIIFGGLGFNIIFNIFRYFREKMENLFRRFVLRAEKYDTTSRIVTLNTKIVLYTTMLLLILGTVGFYFMEYGSTLKEHGSLWGKFTVSFFGSVTPRTAGFNTVNMVELALPTVLLTIFLMWIGASPASTGGGIKTSTFALAVLNIVSIGRTKHRIELGTREVPWHSVHRAFAIIVLSLLIIGTGGILLTLTDAQLGFMAIVFEVVSAYSTVGLSLGATPLFSEAGKWILIVVMFIGRVGSVNLLVGMLRQSGHLPYRYPEESVLLN
jgi:trk system potassium uptake protein TrkH